MKRVCVWVAREWTDRAGKIKREKKADQSLKGVKPADKWVVQWIDAGKRRLEKVDQLGRAGLEAAFAKRAEIETKLRNGDPVVHRRDEAAEARCVAQAGSWELFRQRFEANHLDSNPDLRASTAKLYRQSLDVFEKLCQPKFLSDVTTPKVVDFRALLVKAKAGPETIKRHLRGLRVAINKACEWELIERSPKFPPLGSDSNDPVVIPDEHFEKLYAACQVAQYPSANDQPYTAADWWRGALVLMLFTALRRCEWLNLPWADVSLDRGELVVRKARNKSKRDDRLPLHPIAVAHLRKLTDYGPLVFPFQRFWAGRNRDLAMNALYGEWKRIQKAAGLKTPYRFHDFRDTALTRLACVMAPAQLHAFSRHSDFATTDKHYLGRGAMLNDVLSRVPVPDCLTVGAGAAL